MKPDHVSQTGGVDTELTPVEFLYLDRGRLFSYASQLEDGLTLLRRLRDTVEGGSVDKPAITEREQAERTTAASVAGTNLGIKAEGSQETETTQTDRVSSGGQTQVSFTKQGLDQAKIEHDNLMLIIQRNLEESGRLKPFTGTLPASGLYLFRGPLSFFDWSTIVKLIASLTTLQDMGGAQGIEKLPRGMDEMVRQALDVLSLTGISASMTSGQKSILAPLSDNHLQMTREQLQVIFLRDAAVDAEMVAFAPSDSSMPHTGFGPVKQLSSGLGPLFTNLVGQVDHRVIPISIYIPLATE